MIAQLAQLLLYALFDEAHSQRAVISAISGVILILVVWVVTHSPGLNWVAWVLALPAFVLSLLSAFTPAPALVISSALLEAALYFYAAGSLIAYMMEDSRVTTDELFAAGATFTLLAWGYAFLYLVLQQIVPNSFIRGTEAGQPLTFLEMLFLSFTNLSATGLSDIAVVSPWARVVVMIEQFTGVGYVAVVVSRLVGLTLQRRQRH